MTTPPGPEGSWPLDPQVPTYDAPGATPQYPAPSYPTPTPQYGPPPEPSAYPPEPPSFIPAGQQPVQGVPSQGQPVPPQPYPGQMHVGAPLPEVQPVGSAPGAGLPDNVDPDRVPAQYGYLAIGAVILVAVIGIGVAIWSFSGTPRTSAAAAWTDDPTTSVSKAPSAAASSPVSSKPSATSSVSASGKASASSSASSMKTMPTCIPGQRIVTAAWSATAPSGWTCVSGSVSETSTQLGMIGSQGEIIAMAVSASKDAASACGADIAKPGTAVTALPDTTWGGKTAKTAKVVQSGLEVQVRCVQVKGIVYGLVGEPIVATQTTVISALDALTASWVWS